MEEINLYKLLGFYVRNWLLILSITLAGLAAGLIYNQFIQVPMYKSDATLLLIKEDGVSQDMNATLLNNYVQLFQSRRVLEPVMQDQKLDMKFEDFVKRVSATNEKSTEVLLLSVSTDDPEVSERFLGAAVQNFKSEAEELYGKDNLTIVDDASNAEPPYNVNKVLQLAIASGIGFIVSLLVLFFIHDIKGGKVEDLTLMSRNSKKLKNIKTKANTSKKVKPARINFHIPYSAIFKKISDSAKNSLWIQESEASEPARDKVKKIV